MTLCSDTSGYGTPATAPGDGCPQLLTSFPRGQRRAGVAWQAEVSPATLRPGPEPYPPGADSRALERI